MGQVQVDPEDVQRIVDRTKKVSNELAGGAALKKVELTLSSFGDYDEAQGLVSMHGTAHEVVRATLAGVQQDLDGFATNIERAVGDLYDRDITMQALLQSSLAPFNPAALSAGGGAGVDIYNDLNDETLDNMGGVTGTSHGDEARDEAVNAVNEGGNA